MSEYWQVVQHRGQQTIAVWGTHAATLAVGDDTLATHTALIESLPVLAQARTDQEEAVDSAINARDVARALIRDFGVRAPRKIEGDIPAKDPFHKDIRELRIDPESMDAEVLRGQRTVSLWKKYNVRRAAMTPPKPALLIGGVAVALLETALTGLPDQTQAIEDERSELKVKRSDLSLAAEKGNDVNVRWYAVWEGEFQPNTPQRNALSQIDTGDDILPPTVLEIASLTRPTTNVVILTHATTGGAHGTVLVVEWKIEGEAEFTNIEPLTRPQQEITNSAFAGTNIVFRNRVSNSTGTVFSAEQTSNG